MSYTANEQRYGEMIYRSCGRSGLKLPLLSLGLWHNFGTNDDYDNMKHMCFAAFDRGVTHFDLANNYGPIPGSAEENFGRILKPVDAPRSNAEDEPQRAAPAVFAPLPRTARSSRAPTRSNAAGRCSGRTRRPTAVPIARASSTWVRAVPSSTSHNA